MDGVGVDGLAPVTVVRNGEVRAAGRRLDDDVVYDWGFQLNGRHHEQRSYVLLDDGFQINQPVIFPPAHQVLVVLRPGAGVGHRHRGDPTGSSVPNASSTAG